MSESPSTAAPNREPTASPGDLFLSYNSRDASDVRHVGALLQGRGLRTFIDREHLLVGHNWFDSLEREIHRTRAVAVFLGPHGLGRWQRYERALAMDRKVREEAQGGRVPVIPILLPGAEPEAFSGFLLVNTCVDLRRGLDDPDALDQIERAILGVDPASESSPGAETAALSPYRALEPFREEDAPLFFGRDHFVINPDRPEQGLLHKVRTCPLVAVVGPSGSGKSSVVQAGLWPLLRREPPSRGTWDILGFRPGKYPFLSLATALETVRNPDGTAAARETDAASLSRGWANGDLPLDFSLDRARDALRVNRLLLVVDQFEELFTLTPAGDRRPCVDRLLAAADAARVTVLLTLRGDFYNQALTISPDLSDHLQRGLVNIRAMRRDELREAIERPARLVGLDFETGLVGRILDDVGDEPGNLPLLEFALTELWERRDGRRLTNAAYESLGRVARAIGRRAETVFATLTEDQRAAAPRLFGRLVRLAAADEEGTDTRQLVRLRDLDATARSAVEPFVTGRLIVAGSDETSTSEAPAEADPRTTPADLTTVEVAHEALIRTWDRLKTWIADDRAFLLWRQRLGFLLTEWDRSGRDSGALLRGAPLVEARRFALARRDDLNDRERNFLAQSESASRRLRSWLAAAVVVLLMAMVAVGYAAFDSRLRAAQRLAQANGRVDALATAEIREVPGIIQQLQPDRLLVLDRLRTLARTDPTDPAGQRRRLHAALALLPDDPTQADVLAVRLQQADARPDELIVIRQALLDHGHAAALTPKLWALLRPTGTELTDPQLRAAGALALFDPKEPRWPALGPPMAAKLVQENPLLIGGWRVVFQPVRGVLDEHLRTIYGHRDRPEERALAYTLLFEFATQPDNPGRPEDLAELVAEADPTQFHQLLELLRADRPRAIARLASKLEKPARFDDVLARRQGRVATALAALGAAERVWPLLKHGDDPSVRTELIHNLGRFGVDPDVVIARLRSEPEVSARRALILALGEFPKDRISVSEREALATLLRRWYQDDPDPGVHGGVDWLLRQRWGLAKELEPIDQELIGRVLPEGHDWYVNGQGQTFAVIRGPVEFRMGSTPESDAERVPNEVQHLRRIDRSFAIATKEVTKEQFARFLDQNRDIPNDYDNEEFKVYSPTPDCPQHYVNWYVVLQPQEFDLLVFRLPGLAV
jgi:hypothetical protein